MIAGVLSFRIIKLVVPVMLLGLLFLSGCGEDAETESEQPQMEEPSSVRGNDAPMTLIPAGEFSMGDHHGAGDRDEVPVHTVYLDAFYIDKYEVTNTRYASFLNGYGRSTDPFGNELLDIDDGACLIEKVGDTYTAKPGYGDHPVVKVSWYGAATYAEFYGESLPTEAQWEKAARGGLIGKRYPWGDEPDSTKANYNHDGSRGGSTADMLRYLKPVGNFPPNDYGLHDMAGNVWEWCQDWYDSEYYSMSPRENPAGPTSGSSRVLRGGGWGLGASYLRIAYRDGLIPTTMLKFGFRCAKDAEP